MKYLKATLAVFVCAMTFAAFGASAQTYNITGITIPAFKGSWISSQVDKSSTSVQQVKKTSCTDNLTGDGRVIIGRTYAMLSPAGYSSWIEVPYSYSNWGSENNGVNSYKLWLQSNKNLPTTATFSGSWVY